MNKVLTARFHGGGERWIFTEKKCSIFQHLYEPPKNKLNCDFFEYYRSCCWSQESDTHHSLGQVKTPPRRLCVRWGPSSPPQKKGTVRSNFHPMSIVAMVI